MSGGLRFIKKTEIGERKAENGDRRTESGKRRSEIGYPFSVLCFLLSVLCFLLSVFSPLHAKDRTLFDFPKAYKEATFQFFPIPFFETDPAAGQRYGLMPTFLWYDRDDQLMTIGVAALNYSPNVVGVGGFVGLFVYPSARESMSLFLSAAQHFERDYYFQYINEQWLEKKLDVDVELEYLQDPYERFFGFGPSSPRSNQSNFVSHLWYWKGRVAYEVLPKFDLQVEEKWLRMTMRPRALTSLNEIRTFFAGNREVTDSNQWQHRFSLIYDTRDDRKFPRKGHYGETYGLFSHRTFNGNTFYSGYGFLGEEVFGFNDRFTTVARILTEQLLGETIPFYMQPRLGGKKDLRGFVERRFTGRGRLLFDVEERILVKSWHIMKAKFDVSIDPFFSVGQVFDRWGEVGFDHLQPTGGIGFRALVPPSVVGRVDIGVGREGLEVYTTLDYPF